MNMIRKITTFFLACVFILSSASSSLLVNADNLEGTTLDTTSGIGHYAVTITGSENQLYNVKLPIIRKYDDGTYVYPSNEVYYVTVTDSSDVVNESLSAYYKFEYVYNSQHSYPEAVATIPNVPNGSTITVSNILVERIEYDAQNAPLWSNYRLSYMAPIISNPTDSKDIILIDDVETLKQLKVGETVSQTTKTSKSEDSAFVRETSDTLLSVHNALYGTNYTNYSGTDFLTHLLSTYNVVSLDEIHSTHIVGPIISQNIAERTTENGAVGGFLAAADYSNGVPSYVGEFSTFVNGGKDEVAVKMNYSFDLKYNPYFTAPDLYSDETNLLIHLVGDVNNTQDHYILGKGTEEEKNVMSSNNMGYSKTYQNDEFIDFTALATALQNASQEVLDTGNAEAYEEFVRYEFDSGGAGTLASSTINVYEGGELVRTITSSNGETYTSSDGQERGFSDFVSNAAYTHEAGDPNALRLTINMEESWTVLNAINLEEVNMILPDDYDYYENPYMTPTTINFKCEYINPGVYSVDVDGDGTKEDVTHSFMPFTLIDGDEFDAKLGENGEYGEVGNKIIWNMPNVNTNSETGDNRLSVVHRAHNIAGHIVAPGAEFWNYDSNGGWLGGNLDGTAIVKSFYSGIMEMHMWAYTGLAEEYVLYRVNAIKTVNGEKPESDYTFILDVVYEDDGSIPSGILNTVFPVYASSDTDSGKEGLIHFSNIAFADSGTYSFIVYEDTSMDKPTDNVIYDKTQYRIDITVGETSDSTVELTKYEVTGVKKYRIADSDGNPLSEPELLEDIPSEYEFKFDNTTTEEGLVDMTLHKHSSAGHVLPGAKFYVTEMNEDGSDIIADGYFKSITSDADGKIYIAGLQKNTYYKIEEYEAPSGHVKGDGYWVAHIGPQGFLLSIEARDGAEEIGKDMIIHNDPVETDFLDITLTKMNTRLANLEGVSFNLKRVVLDSNGKPHEVVGGYNEDYTSDVSGKFTISNLEGNHIYMLTETSTPEGHVAHTGYWLIDVKGNTSPLTYTIIEYDSDNKVVGEVTDDIIINEVADFVLPGTGGIGSDIFRIIGSIMIGSALILYMRKNNKKIQKVR